jgi:hypothetical protein
MHSQIFKRMGLANGWVQETAVAAIAIGFGFGILPLLIFLAGNSLLGRYEGASPARMYDSVYGGLDGGSAASWIVVFGPYGLYLSFRGLKAWWRASARLAESRD